jgi:hypothetical protein
VGSLDDTVAITWKRSFQMSRFTAFLWICWIIFLLTIFSFLLIPLAIVLALIAPIVIIAYIIA